MAEKEKLFYGMARPAIRELEEYDPGPMPAGVRVRVSANENNRGLPDAARAAIISALGEGNRYAESRCTELRRGIAGLHGLSPEQIFVSNGLDGFFTTLGRAFLEPGDEVVCAELTFGVYRDTAVIAGALPVTVPMREDFSCDARGFIEAVTERTKMLCFCNPNNPTGTAASPGEITEMLDAVPQNVLFVLDEAYIDFADDPAGSGMKLLDKYPNLIVCRTFSKIYGLAGLRVGYAAADPELLRFLYKVREPYCVSALSAAAAASVLRDSGYSRESREMVLREREKLCAYFREKGIRHIPSQANFIMLLMDNSDDIRDKLLGMGIAARSMGFRGKKQVLRISVGLPEENNLLIQALSDILG